MTSNEKIALVTGASRGIGRAIAVQLAESGHHVVINYSGNQQAAEETQHAVQQLGKKAMIYQADVSDEASVNDMVRNIVNEWGAIHTLVNNAGITRDTLLMRMKSSDWQSVINTNLNGVYFCTKAVTRPMIKQRTGRIINIASVVAALGNVGQANYAAAKAGVIGFSKTTARELAPRGITVNVVAPGFIDTDMTAALSTEVQDQIIGQIPLGRLGQSDEVAKVVAFLASENATYITGQTVYVDGGMYMN